MAMMNLNKIVLDQTIYPRAAVSHINVGRLVAALKTGAKLPPLIIEATTLRLVDGWHRHEAFKQCKIAKVEVVQKSYTSEADLFADAVRYNIGHGEPLDQYCVRSAIIRLEKYGYTRESISQVTRLPVEQIEKIARRFASNGSGEPVALKGGLSHMAGQQLSAAQLEINRHYVGGKAAFYAKQLGDLLEHDMWPMSSSAFFNEMNRLMRLWSKITQKSKGKAA